MSDGRLWDSDFDGVADENRARIDEGYSAFWVPLVEENEVLRHNDEYRVTGSSDDRWLPVSKHNRDLSISKFRNNFEMGGSVFEFRRFVTRDEYWQIFHCL